MLSQVPPQPLRNEGQLWKIHDSLLFFGTDLVVISPATANIIGKIAHGIVDNLLTTVVMATPKETPVLIVPAMNTNMWENFITQKNVEILSEYKRYKFIYPRKGVLACPELAEGLR